MKKVILLAGFILLTLCISKAQENKPNVVLVADSLYMVGNVGGNVAFLITCEGVVVIDACETPDQAALLMRIIKEKTSQPIKYVIYTHYHFDHTGGIMGFPNGISIIGQENIVKNINNINTPELRREIDKALPDTIAKLEKLIEKQKSKVDKNLKSTEELLTKMKTDLNKMLQIRNILPNITFTDKITLNVGGQAIDILNPGNCHTSCNAIVIFKNKNVLHTGDLLFNHAFPYIDINAGANTEKWSDKLFELSHMGFKSVIPGHMTLTDCESLKYEGNYLSALRNKVKELIDKGQKIDEIKKNIQLGEYEKFDFQFLRNQNIDAVYNELTVKK